LIGVDFYARIAVRAVAQLKRERRMEREREHYIVGGEGRKLELYRSGEKRESWCLLEWSGAAADRARKLSPKAVGSLREAGTRDWPGGRRIAPAPPPACILVFGFDLGPENVRAAQRAADEGGGFTGGVAGPCRVRAVPKRGG